MNTMVIWILVSTVSGTQPHLVYGPKFANEKDCNAARAQMTLVAAGQFQHHCVKMEPGR